MVLIAPKFWCIEIGIKNYFLYFDEAHRFFMKDEKEKSIISDGQDLRVESCGDLIIIV